VSMSDELKERNLSKLILIMRFACATLDVGHYISSAATAEARRPLSVRKRMAARCSTHS
jgi:thioester reductase-like protein